MTIRFVEDGPDRARMGFRQGVFDTTADRDGHRGGWTECFERFAAHLAAGGGQGG